MVLTLTAWLSLCRPCSPTCVVAITNRKTGEIVLAADSLVRHRYTPSESKCKIHVVTTDCTVAMVGMYKQQFPAFDLLALSQFACRGPGDLKQRADTFLSTALPRVTEAVNYSQNTDPDSLKQQYEGKPIIEVLFAGAYKHKPAIFVRGAVLENGVLKPEAVSVPSERVHLFAGVNGHIRAYIQNHPGWEADGGVPAALRLIKIEVEAHPDIVGPPISVGTVNSNGEFHWVQRGECEEPAHQFLR
ncbi:MAG: hypothetical protein ACRD3B_09625 [Candidatus Sulfotelmatobacter sp.]